MTESPTVTDIANLFVAATALIVAVISAVFARRAYSLQRVTSTPEGLQFLICPMHRRVLKDNWNPDYDDLVMQHNTLVGVHARSAGVRYNVSLAVWGEVEARFLGEQRTTWAAEDGILSAEIFGRPTEFNEPVYFGVVWESRSLTGRRFVGHGYRVQLKWNGQRVEDDYVQVWSDRAQSWRLMPQPIKQHKGPAHESKALSHSLYEQMRFEAYKRHWA